jgi:hypothetical protein
MKTFFPLIIVILILQGCTTGTPKTEQQEPEKWIQLFNGVDLEGWTPKIAGHPLGENYNNTFRVENGMMITRYDQYDQFKDEFGHIFYKTPYSHYKLRVEYRIVGEQVPGGLDWAYKNSGVMFHSQAPETMGLDQSFPVCVEAQLLGGNGQEERSTGNVCTPGTHVEIDGMLVTDHCILSTSATFHGEEWVNFELVVYGDSIIHHIVNGDTVLTYAHPVIGGELPEGFPIPEGTPVTSGYIALQAESHPFEFRKVELLDLSPKE